MRRALRGLLQSIATLPTQASALTLILIAIAFGIAVYREWIDERLEELLTLSFATVVGYWLVVQLADVLAGLLGPRRTRQASPVTSSPRDAAAHEAGRLIAATALGRDMLTVIEVDQARSPGLFRGAPDLAGLASGDVEAPTREDLVYLLAGQVATNVITGGAPRLSANDRRAWERLARLHAAAAPRRRPWFEAAKDEHEARVNAGTLQRIWDDSWAQASAILAANHDTLERIVNALLSTPDGRLSEEAARGYSAEVQGGLFALPHPDRPSNDG